MSHTNKPSEKSNFADRKKIALRALRKEVKDIRNIVRAALQALMNRDTEAIKGVLRQGFHANYIFPVVRNGRFRGSVPAYGLLRKFNTSLPETFLENDGRFLNFNDSLGNIMLHHAARISDYELIRLLLEKGADVTSTDRRCCTALHIACKEDSLEIIKFLVQKSPAYILDFHDRRGNTPLDVACAHNCPDAVQLLLSQGSSVSAKHFPRRGPLLSAVFNVAEYAIPIASLLLDAGANISHSYGYEGTALMRAVKQSASEMPRSPYSVAGQNYPCRDLCMLLIDRGCNVNAVNILGETALHYAIETNQEDLVRKLILSGSDIDVLDGDGFSPLHYACKCGSQRLVDLLITSGANLRNQDWKATFEKWRSSQELNEKSTKLLEYIISESQQCLTLENLCNITIRKSVSNIEKNALELGLPPLLVNHLQLKW